MTRHEAKKTALREVRTWKVMKYLVIQARLAGWNDEQLEQATRWTTAGEGLFGCGDFIQGNSPHQGRTWPPVQP